MRKLQNLSKNEQSELSTLFPDMEKLISVEETESYTYIAISVFDHWLGKEDSTEHLSNVSPKQQQKRDDKFNAFSNKIIENTEVVNFTMRGRPSSAHPLFRRFLSELAKREYMTRSSNYISSKYFFKVALPELKAIYFESWDDTNVFYLRDEKNVALLETWANECGLYKLDKW